jgi:hypothetical protein
MKWFFLGSGWVTTEYWILKKFIFSVRVPPPAQTLIVSAAV